MSALTITLIISLVVIPAFFGIYRDYKVMSVSVIAIALALSFANIDKFSRFSGGGFEAELKTAVDKAYAAIDQLKELGLTLSSPIVDDLAMSGRIFDYMPLKYKFDRVEKISENLRKLGAS